MGGEDTTITLVSYGEISDFNNIKAFQNHHRRNQLANLRPRLTHTKLLLNFPACFIFFISKVSSSKRQLTKRRF